MPTRLTSRKRPINLGPMELEEHALAWAEQMFAPLPGSQPSGEGWAGHQTVAVTLQTDDRDDDCSSPALKRRLARLSEVRSAIAGAVPLIEFGDLAAARDAIRAIADTDLPRVYWCESPAELAMGLVDCLSHAQHCFECGPIEGSAGRVIWMLVCYDPAHPI